MYVTVAEAEAAPNMATWALGNHSSPLMSLTQTRVPDKQNAYFKGLSSLGRPYYHSERAYLQSDALA